MWFAVLTEGAANMAGKWHARGAVVLLVAAVSYNWPLAFLNAHGVPVGRNTLIAVEAALMAFGLSLALTRWRTEMTRWLLMIGCFFLLSMLLSQLRQGFDPKSFRDTLMFAVFVMVGMLLPMPNLRRTLVAIQALILIVMLVEVTFPDQYGAFVDPRSYFINSRGFTEEQLSGDSDIFGAVHGEERYILPQLGWNRASSIFLEPLSLGNYVSFATLALLLFWRDWRWGTRLFMAVSTILILIGSDGRFAAGSAIILLLLAPLLRRLPPVLSIFYLPLGVLTARVVSLALDWNPLNDDFPGRIARGMKRLFLLDWHDVGGFSVPTPALADSGIAYLVMAQSLVGVVMLQLFLYVQPELKRPEQRLVLHGTALTFALSILVSISMLSIKTAAFYWLLMGTVIALPQPRASHLPHSNEVTQPV
jgi:putative polymerase